MNKTIAVIGAGASGFMCAISAKRRLNETGKNARVLLIEKNSRAGKKLLATGNGKCNLTNTNQQIQSYHSNDIDVAGNILSAFDAKAVIDFFNEIALTTVTDHGSCVYPRSMQAASVLDALRFEAQRLGVELLCDFEILNIKKSDKTYNIYSNSQTICADAVVIASGSAASGGSDSGISILKSFGHKIYPQYPALTAIKCETDIIKTAKGMRTHADITLIVDSKNIHKQTGEVLFCDYGVSGIAVMQLSGYVSHIFGDGKKHDIRLQLDLAPEYTQDELLALLNKQKTALNDMELENLLCGFLNKRIAMAVIKYANIGALSKKVSSLTDTNLRCLSQCIKCFELQVTGTNGAKNAQVMGGGAALSDFDINTLMSKKSPALFACGEVLDVYGDCGGYNLTWAWASGFVCGNAAADIV